MSDNASYNWVNIIFVVGMPFVALIGLAIVIPVYGFSWLDVGVFVLLYSWGGLSITAGYHRMFSHRAYEAHWTYRLFHLLGGSLAFEGSALQWSADHRVHHSDVDLETDPYAITKGFFFAHMGWLFTHRWSGDVEGCHDLEKDPLVMWQHRNFLWTAIALAFVLPFLLGLPFGDGLLGRAIPFLVWGGAVKTVALHHSTWLINSAAHVWGKQPYGTQDTSRDSWWLAYLTFGEGYHNFHHTFQADYRNGLRWWQVDPTKWWIAFWSWFGLTSKLRRTAPAAIERNKLDVQQARLNAQFESRGGAAAESLKERLAEGRARLDEAVKSLAEARRKYRRERQAIRKARSDAWKADWKQLKAQWSERIRAAREELGAQRSAYMSLVRGLTNETATATA